MHLHVQNRRKRIARMIAVAAAVALASTVVACGSDDSGGSSGDSGGETAASNGGGDQEKQIRVAFFGLAAVNVYTTTMFDAMKAEAEKLNATVEFFDGKFDGGVQTRQVQDATTSGRFDALIIMANDAVGIAPAAQQAIQAGLTVSALQYPIGPKAAEAQPQVEGIATQVIEDVIKGAEITADGVNTACKDRDPCKVMMLWGNRESASEAAKVPVFEGALDPNVQLVNQSDTSFLRAEARKITADVLQANPDLDAVASTGDQMTYGAEESITKAGKTVGTGPDDVVLIGYGATTEGIDKIKEDAWLQSFTLLPQTMAVKALELTVQAARGEEIPENERGIEQSTLSPIGPNATKESLEKDPSFKGEYPAL